ncbi:MAG TPA: hypothetical protein VIF60_22635 [Burkholderiaceae bacterium]
MSAPTTISNSNLSALQGLHLRGPLERGQSAAPSQNQISFANLVTSLQGHTSASASTTPNASVGINATGAASPSSDAQDLTSLIEAMLSGTGFNAGSASQVLNQTPPEAMSQLGPHRHHAAGVMQIQSAMKDAGSSAVSAYSAMSSADTQAAQSAALSAHV